MSDTGQAAGSGRSVKRSDPAIVYVCRKYLKDEA